MHEHDLSGLSRYPLAFGAVQSIHLCDVMPALVRCFLGSRMAATYSAMSTPAAVAMLPVAWIT